MNHAAPVIADDAAATPAKGIELRPLQERRAMWASFLDSPQATLFHGPQWPEILERSYGLQFHVAILREAAEPIAACLLARSRRPWTRRLVALPFTDACPPLTRRDGADSELLSGLATRTKSPFGFEIRGAAAPPSWRVVNCFHNWSLDLDRPIETIGKAMDRNFRRQIKRAIEAGVSVVRGASPEFARRFYALHLATRRRLGLPAPPWRFLREVQAVMGDRMEVYLAIAGGRDLAGALVLRDGARLHWKWNARHSPMPTGTGHLLAWHLIEEQAGHFDQLDLGRTDVGNEGLIRFKREMGATPTALPYAFYPKPPAQVSVEDASAGMRLLAALWRRLPLPLARALGGAIYGYLS